MWVSNMSMGMNLNSDALSYNITYGFVLLQQDAQKALKVLIAKGCASTLMAAAVTLWLAPVTTLLASLGLTAVKVSHSTNYEIDMLK